MYFCPDSYQLGLMSDCVVCGDGSTLLFRCSYCDGVYCESHRLPEAHECDGVRFLSDAGKRFESKFNDELVHEGDEISDPEPLDPGQTVGSTREPNYESSPPVEVRTDEGGAARVRRLWRRLWTLFK